MKSKKPKLILGFVGKFCAGKGVAVSYLCQKHGFYASSCSDRIREEILANGEEITRERLQEVAGRLRKEFGPAVLAQRTWGEICRRGVEKSVVDSIRGVGEVEFLKKIPGFFFIAVLADPKIRFQRMRERARGLDDLKTWEEFQEAERRDLNRDGRNIEACIKMADFTIENSGSTDELYQKIDEILEKIND